MSKTRLPPAWVPRPGRLEYTSRATWRGEILGTVQNTIDADSMERSITARVVGGPRVAFNTQTEAMRWVEITAVLALEE